MFSSRKATSCSKSSATCWSIWQVSSRSSIDLKLVQGQIIDLRLVQSQLIDFKLVQSQLIDLRLVQSQLIDLKLVQGQLIDLKLVQSQLTIYSSNTNHGIHWQYTAIVSK